MVFSRRFIIFSILTAGSKPPLRVKNAWTIRGKLQLECRTRDLTLFNLGVDSKLRGCDLVRLRVEDVAPRGCAVDQALVRQRKTGPPVKFELAVPARVGRCAAALNGAGSAFADPTVREIAPRVGRRRRTGP